MIYSPCSCPEHIEKFCLVSHRGRDGQMHDYLLHEDDRGWRFLCSCGRRSQFTKQSPNVPYHHWLMKHIKEEVVGQESPDTWHYTSMGIRSESGDLVCDDPDPLGCDHILCNVGKPKVNLNDWRGTDSETTTRQKRRALAMLEENVQALKSMPLRELDLDGLRIAVRKTTP